MKQTALITGGTRGIGLGIAQRLADDGFDVAIFATKSLDVVREQIAAVNAAGSDTLYIRGNVACAAECASCVEQTVARYGKIDVLVNNAGIAPKVRADLLDTTEESMDEVFGVNIKGTFFMSQATAKQMMRQKSGVIINISSVSAFASSVNRAEYCISKAAVSMMTTLFADRLAAHGIRVYEIRPGIIKTDMTAPVAEKYNRLIDNGTFPIRRWGCPEDVAKAVAVFASGSFPYSTGEIINVDGGFHLKSI
ncbi:MAG: 3-ketoacyl-ACP reductase [Bacteroidales bacterium]|jgi:NAD(P)-dependent dehydrogenase (short-subunit alcohol dehydrogenase family)|nr:3-ketoacyl-ACP reductase [Bacteroidales bacterium]